MEKMKKVLSREIDVNVDNNLFKDFRQYVLSIYCRDDDHVKFLSSNMIGLHTPYFHKSDENYFWDSIMNVDRVELSREFHYPQTMVKKEWNISGDLMNNGLVWLIHLILNSKMKADDKEAFVKEILVLFQYKFLTSKIFRDYSYGANQNTAMATHDALGGHFLIKKVDSWMEYFRLRADRMWLGEGKHKDMVGILKSYDNDRHVNNVISGIANNMATMMKAYNKIFHALHDAGVGISLSSPVELDKDGVATAADQTTGFGRYLRILDSRVGIRDEFINDELISIIVSETTARERKVKDLLNFITENYGSDKYKEVEKYVTNGAIFAFTELFNEGVAINDIRSVVKSLLGKMGARRNGNDVFEQFERYGNKVLRSSIGLNKHGISAKNVAVVYMVVWTLLSDKEV